MSSKSKQNTNKDHRNVQKKANGKDKLESADELGIRKSLLWSNLL